jgi:glycosyltransferase involved in cell wall biosynthesis
MLEGMACGCAIVLAMNGEAYQIAVQKAGAAIYAEPENADSIISAILYLQKNPEEGKAMGRRGRAYAEAHFDYDKLVSMLNERIQALLEPAVRDTVLPAVPVPVSVRSRM